MEDRIGKIALVGCGVIGRSWAIVFARAGARVQLFDKQPDAGRRAIGAISAMLVDLLADPVDAENVLGCLSVAASLEEALDGAVYAQESVAETLEAKRAIFAEMDKAAPVGCILASSCSSLSPDDFLSGRPGVDRCLIAHPFNPPHLIPIVELVPATDTSEKTVDCARQLLCECGQYPVLLKKPTPGYIGNRLQAAVVGEVMHLVAQGVASPADIDACLRFGLGMRWALMGPLETMDLNADGGIGAYIEKFGADYQALAQKLGVANPWTEETIRCVTAARRKMLSIDHLKERMAWRDRTLLRIKEIVSHAREDD